MILLSFFLFGLVSAGKCPITDDINIIYSTVNGVGPASKIWVEDFLWWWKQNDPSINYLGMSANDMQNCDLASFPNLRVYINPGGDAYDQLTSLGVEGSAHIKSFVGRNQSVSPSAYVGFCAGGYIASTGYLWETMYEGPGYYNFDTTPPLGLFPHLVEGSIVDINDDQYGDQSGSNKFRLVNVSNGHEMLYYGGSTFGFNGVPAYADPSSPEYDKEIEVLVYYSDFYGYHTFNMPAAWKYRNAILTSVHPEADNCTLEQNYDCPPAGTIPYERIMQNRAWLASYINLAAQTTFIVPSTALPPSFDTTAPHTTYPTLSCQGLFCDSFDANTGLYQFQRNQTDYQHARPWNITYITTWNNYYYGVAASGSGYAIVVPMASTLYQSEIRTKPIDISVCATGEASLSFMYRGKTLSSGYFNVEYSYDDFESTTELIIGPLNPALVLWTPASFTLPAKAHASLQVRFVCAAGSSVDNYCAIDSLSVACI